MRGFPMHNLAARAIFIRAASILAHRSRHARNVFDVRPASLVHLSGMGAVREFASAGDNIHHPSPATTSRTRLPLSLPMAT